MEQRYKEIWERIGLNVFYYRRLRRFTQEELSAACGENGISRDFEQKIETGTCSCSMKVLIDLAAALDVPLEKLFEDW